MENHHKLRGLEWLINEVETNLAQSYDALSLYLEEGCDGPQLRYCLGYIHQVCGSLKLAECYSGVLLTEEMEQLVEAMLEDRVSNVSEAAEVLVQAIHKLPEYLYRLIETQTDRPETLLMLLNDIRAVRDEQLASENSLFSPSMDFVASGGNFTLASDEALLVLVRKLRQMYQLSLLGLLKGKDVEKSARQLEKIFTRARELCRGTTREHLWRIAGAVTEGIFHHSIPLTIAVRVLLRDIDREFRLLINHGRDAFAEPFPEGFVKNLLFYIAHSCASTPRIRKISVDFRLENALPKGSVATSNQGLVPLYDRVTVKAISEEIANDLKEVKDAVEAYAQGDPGCRDRLQVAVPVLKRISDTLAMVGQGQVREMTADILLHLNRYIDRGDGDFQDLQLLATRIIDIESAIESWATDARRGVSPNGAPQLHRLELDRAHQSLLREISNGIEKLKEGIVGYIASQKDPSRLSKIPGLVDDMIGAMTLAGMTRSAEIVRSCGSFIQTEMLFNPEGPNWDALDALADAITSVEFFIEDLLAGTVSQDRDVLALGESSVAELGYPVAESKEVTVVEGVDIRGAVDEIEAVTPAVWDEQMEAETELHEDFGEDGILSSGDVVDPGPVIAVSGGSPLSKAETDLLSMDTGPNRPDDSVVSSDQLVEDAEDGVDPEIRDIFVEEAGEVLAALRENFPLWRENRDNRDALSELRRAFHTLKGSGRMVRAQEIGELSWKIENLLNRVLNNQVAASPAIADLIGASLNILPAMVAAFAQGKPVEQGQQALQLEQAADVLSKGGNIDMPSSAASGHQPANSLETLETPQSDEPGPKAGIPATDARAVTSGEDPCGPDECLKLATPEVRSEALPSVGHETRAEVGIIEQPQARPDERPEIRAENQSPDQSEPQSHAPEQLPETGNNSPDSDLPGPACTGDLDTVTGHEDESLCEVFVTEALDHLEELDRFINHAKASCPPGIAPTPEVLRALHTLKGSAHMLAVSPVAAMVTPLEQLLRDMFNSRSRVDAEIVEILSLAPGFIREALERYRRGAAEETISAVPFLERLARLCSDREPHKTTDNSELTGHVPGRKDSLDLLMSDSLVDVLDAEPVLEQWRHGLKSDEAGDDFRIITKDLVQALRVLVDSARSNSLPPLSALAEQLAAAYENIVELGISYEPELAGCLRAGHEALLIMGDALASEQELIPVDTVLLKSIRVIARYPSSNSEPVRALDLIMADQSTTECEPPTTSPASDSPEPDTEPANSVSGTPGPAIELPEQVTMTTAGDRVGNGVQSEDASIETTPSEGSLPADIRVEASPAPGSAGEPAMAMTGEQGTAIVDTADTDSGDDEEELPLPQQASIAINSGKVTADESITGQAADVEVEPLSEVGPSAVPLPDDFDREIAGIFLEEAEELLEQMEQSLNNWQQDRSDQSAVALLKRALHTFKGGARMAGLEAFGDASHEFETEVISSAHYGDNAKPGFLADLFRRFDALLNAVALLRQEIHNPEAQQEHEHDSEKPGTPTTDQHAGEESENTAEFTAGPEVEMPVEADVETGKSPDVQEPPNGHLSLARVIPFAGLGSGLSASGIFGPTAGVRPGSPEVPAIDRPSTPQEMVKIAAPVLDNLVSLAGETSISRGQIEQQLNAFAFSLEEMEATIRRMQDQVRRLGVETDAQVIFHREQIESSEIAEDFDPLELDRYSQLQQLSLALLESASDLQDIKETMMDKSRDAESLLLQQSRINTDLQESLMRTRMVPFSRMIPRLRRIVRQVGSEVNKRVALKLENVEGEMDRSVLEKMVPPLEHMIRNAIDHGIETPEQRKEQEKDPQGTIELSFCREGGDVVIQLSDDGRGLDVDAIRRRAVERGLMHPEAVLSEREISHFIFEPGFSTASTVTQVSGRGVGMDVVNSEVRQLGGSIQIVTHPGAGTRFIVRLPFTVSVNRVVMIEVGGESYALALNSIDGVMRMSRDELVHYYQYPNTRLEHGGKFYEVRYLGNLLNDHVSPDTDPAPGLVFLILVHADQHRYAVQVDDLLGTREIVVKTLGAQFRAVPGLSGATITGDGRVVAILDLPALLRDQQKSPSLANAGLLAASRKSPAVRISTVMVVDDSVTVRKVTGRILERQGYRVITARDGFDAMRVLQDHSPDLMLLDIEMPRMDGFEVARLVRGDSRLKSMPIIMITSRTGEKHRQKALTMGVNTYLGKPYREETLLAAVSDLLNTAAAG